MPRRKQSESMKQWKSIGHTCCICGSGEVSPHHRKSKQDRYWKAHPDEDMDAAGNLAAACLQCHNDYKNIIGKGSEPWQSSIENEPVMYGGRVSEYLKAVRKYHPRDSWAMCQPALKDAYMVWFAASSEQRKAAGR